MSALWRLMVCNGHREELQIFLLQTQEDYCACAAVILNNSLSRKISSRAVGSHLLLPACFSFTESSAFQSNVWYCFLSSVLLSFLFLSLPSFFPNLIAICSITLSLNHISAFPPLPWMIPLIVYNSKQIFQKLVHPLRCIIECGAQDAIFGNS